MKTITWREVLDSNVGCRAGANIVDFLPTVAVTGYKYFCWNGRIYQYISPSGYDNTGITVDDLPATLTPDPLQKALDAVDEAEKLWQADIPWVNDVEYIVREAKKAMRTLYEETTEAKDTP